jgi:hypothetical protein
MFNSRTLAKKSRSEMIQVLKNSLRGLQRRTSWTWVGYLTLNSAEPIPPYERYFAFQHESFCSKCSSTLLQYIYRPALINFLAKLSLFFSKKNRVLPHAHHHASSCSVLRPSFNNIYQLIIHDNVYTCSMSSSADMPVHILLYTVRQQ